MLMHKCFDLGSSRQGHTRVNDLQNQEAGAQCIDWQCKFLTFFLLFPLEACHNTISPKQLDWRPGYTLPGSVRPLQIYIWILTLV